MRKLRTGVIGGGKHLRRSHLAVGRDDFELRAVFDPSDEDFKQAIMSAGVGKSSVHRCGSAQELVGLKDLDVVLIGSPDEFHPEQLRLAVEAGKPVLCEKPFATDQQGLDSVRRSLAIAKRRKLPVTSCFPRRDTTNTDLPYGWITANFTRLKRRFGALQRIGFNSNYPRPSAGWKEKRSFLIDKAIHDIDYLRFLLGNKSFIAARHVDSHDHYEVSGTADGTLNFSFIGSRLHGSEDEFIETITLNFAYGSCVVYTKTGEVRYRDERSGRNWTEHPLRPMNHTAYDRIFASLMRDFAIQLRSGRPARTFDDLLISNEAVTQLATRGSYTYKP